MKRRLIPGLMLAITLSFAGCTDQLVSPIQENDIIVDDAIKVPSQVADGDPYQVLVESNETKTITEQGTNGKWSTDWVDAASASQNARSGPDMINLFSKKTGSQDYKSHGKFTYVGNQTFDGNLSGGLEDLGDSNDWYSIYPFNENSSSAATGITARVVIGASSANEYTQEQNGANSMSHLAGDNYPMYGIKNNVAKNKTPKFKMSHLYSVIALKIVNDGDGNSTNETSKPINITTIQLSAPEDVVGDFAITISGDEPKYTPISGKTSLTASVETPSLSINPGQSATVYFAVKPFDASRKNITLSVNGGTKTITMPANFKFEAGKITTMRVPVGFYLGNVTTNVIDEKGTDMEFKSLFGIGVKKDISVDMITFTGSSESEKIINGEKVNVYTLGSRNSAGTNSCGSVTIKGKAPEFIRLMPIQFYAASSPEGKSVMRMGSIKAKVFAEVFGIGTMKEVSMSFNQLVNNGIVLPERLSFDGLVPISIDSNNQSIILYEEPVHKMVSEEAADQLVRRFDPDKTDGIYPTYAGLKKALTQDSKNWDNEATTTATLVTEKVKPIIKEYLGGTLGSLFDVMFGSPTSLFELLKENVTLEVTLETAPIDIEAGITDTRVLVWGLNSPNSN